LAPSVPSVAHATRRKYEPAVGRTLDRGRIWLYNAVCAISFLANRCGVPSDVKHCGRTLAEDLAWVDIALSHVSAR
jgi:hypothetical protein